MKQFSLIAAAMLLFGGTHLRSEDPIAPIENPGGEEAVVRGVNPADNLTKFEILPKYTSIDESADVSIFTQTFKYDQAIAGIYGLNFELPVAFFDSPFADADGIGDFNLRGRYQHRDDAWTYLFGAEAVFPTATDDALGSGQYQLNPVLAAVYAFSPQTFVAFVAKHSFSLAGDPARDEIVMGQYRAILAHTTQEGWWFLADPQIFVDYENDSRVHFAPEFEVGKMINATTGVWIRGGAHLGGDWDKDAWGIGGGIRIISF